MVWGAAVGVAIAGGGKTMRERGILSSGRCCCCAESDARAKTLAPEHELRRVRVGRGEVGPVGVGEGGGGGGVEGGGRAARDGRGRSSSRGRRERGGCILLVVVVVWVLGELVVLVVMGREDRWRSFRTEERKGGEAGGGEERSRSCVIETPGKGGGGVKVREAVRWLD